MRHATMNSPPSTIAPPTPTTTPITVILVLCDMPLEELLLVWLARATVLVAVITTSAVEDDVKVIWEPLTVETAVTTLTDWLVVVTTSGVWVVLLESSVEVVLTSSDDEDDAASEADVVCAASELVDTAAGVGVSEVERAALDVGLWTGVEVESALDVVKGVADAEVLISAVVDAAADVADVGTWADVLSADEVAVAETAFFASSRPKMFTESSQAACVRARRSARMDSIRSGGRDNMLCVRSKGGRRMDGVCERRDGSIDGL